jgi:hypothetical protein
MLNLTSTKACATVRPAFPMTDAREERAWQ